MMYKLKGKVKTGLGEGHFWTEKISGIFKEKYGINLFLGTLNIELEKDYILKEENKILPHEYGGDYEVLLHKCKIQGHNAYIVRPKKNNDIGGDHPLNIIEIVSDKNLRKEHNLKDNDRVIIEIINK